MPPSKRNFQGSGSKCITCNARANESRTPCKYLFGGVDGKTEDNLENQISVYFLLRKILGLSHEFLENLLIECGNPSAWKIQLCRHCTRLFMEAEYLWDKIKKVQKEFQNVSKEMKDMLTRSITTEEEKTAKNKNLGLRKLASVQKLKSSQVSDGIRTAFFIHLNDQISEKSIPSPHPDIKETSKDCDKNSGLLTWSDNGIPYLSLATFEKKMQDLIEIAAKNNCSSAKHPELKNLGISEVATQTQTVAEKTDVRTTNHFNFDGNDNDEEMEIDMSQHHRSTGNLNITTSKSTNISINILSKKDNTATNRAAVGDEDQESTLRIVQTSSLMESDEESDNDAVPHLIGVLKHDPDRNIIELDSGESLGDPLALDGDDPDFLPCSPSPALIVSRKGREQPSSTNDNEQLIVKKPDETPSKFRSLSIQASKKGPKVFECSKCTEGFETRLGCQAHILRDHYDDRQPFHCHVCSLKFTLIHPLKEHLFKSHGGIRTPYDDDFDPATDYISLEFSKQILVETDEKLKDRRSGPVMYDCPVCSQSFTVKRNMQRHAKTVHGVVTSQLASRRPSNDGVGVASSTNGGNAETSAVYSCDKCAKNGITFKARTKEVLDIHMKKCLNSNTARSMVRKKIVERTQVVKSGMKCPDCDKILPTSQAMADHLKNPENKCQDCNKHFLFEMDLKRHIELQHAKRNALQCPYCPKSFSAQVIYEKHIENHQIHDVHECEVCHEKFTGFANLNRHLETHAAFLQQQQLQQDSQMLQM